ncbi:hypothetical protein EDD15DRAFT_2273763 [Pisolithus albus]|nr:hypothetical protein EDD15DRAFT_2273763 [Pisolithus albus]
MVRFPFLYAVLVCLRPGTTRDWGSGPSSGCICPLSGISSRPPLQQRTPLLPSHHPLSPHRQQPHSSHTHTYSRATGLGHRCPLPNPRSNEEPIIPIYHIHPQHGHPSPFAHETSQIPPPGRPNSRPPPTREPYAFRLPTHPLV